MSSSLRGGYVTVHNTIFKIQIPSRRKRVRSLSGSYLP